VGGFHTFGLGTQAYRWTAGDVFEGLGDLPGGALTSVAFDASADGSVIVGYGTTAVDDEAFRWTRATGMAGLGDLPGGGTQSAALGVSADGATIVGYGSSATAGRQAFRWTAATGMTELGFLPGANESQARAVSADGSVVVGESSLPPTLPPRLHIEAFRWTQSEGMVGLGDLPGGPVLSIAYDVSADGSVIVGGGERAFYWTAATGMFNLQNALDSFGATGLDGWTLVDARGVSADGLTIAGTGLDPIGRTQAWVAIIPEPSTVLLTIFAAAGVLAFALRRITRERYSILK
jgi:probable HAF family extracellular repeat protein